MNTADPLNIERIKFNVLSDYIDEGVIITNSQRNVVKANKAVQELTGYGEYDMLDKFIGDFIKLFEEENEISPEVYCPTSDVILDSDAPVVDKKAIKLVTRSNESKVVDVIVKKIRETRQEDVGTIMIIKDTSKETELERMKLDFVSMTAHVLRTPVTIIRGYAQVLLKDDTVAKLGGNELEAVNQINTSSQDLAKQIESLLTMAEVREGKIEVRLMPISIENTVTSVFNDYKLRAQHKGLTMTYIPPQEPLPMVNADVVRTKEVLSKIIDNAINFTDEGQIQVGVMKEEQNVRVVIQDTGKGIPKESLEHLFTKFFRVKTALDMQAGRGLSLYLCKKLVDAMQGEIGVESVEGQGSTFWFTLPIAEKRF